MWGAVSSTFGSVDMDEDELCLIDARIASLGALNLRPQLKSLNLHCNAIQRLENLLHLRNLQHLDLSSNQIARMEGLDGLVSLRTLNLACNLIETVKGLGNCRSLTKINLSFNNIDDVSGFYEVRGTEFRLEQVELQGNKLANQDHVVSCLMGCQTLSRLTLRHGGADNPVCHLTGYREKMLAGLPQLKILDSQDRAGQATLDDEVLADIPGLDQYLEYLVSSNGSTEGNPLALATPRIDAALAYFKSQDVTTPDVSTCVSDQDVSHVTTSLRSSKENEGADSQAVRLEKLENQLAQLLHVQRRSQSSSDTPPKEKTPVKVVRHTPKRDTDHTDESDTDAGRRERCQRTGRSRGRGRKTRIPSYQRSTEAWDSRSKSREREQKRSPCRSPAREDVCGRHTPTDCMATTTATAIAADRQRKEDVQNTYVELMRELEVERERRWKSEQATKKLVDHIKELQSKAKDNEGFQETAVGATTRLKHALTNERELRARLTQDSDQLKSELEETKAQLTEVRQSEAAQRAALSAAESSATKAEREYLKQHAHEAKKAQEAGLRAAAAGRELDLVRNTVKNLKGQVQQLQSLLADREQEHRKELAGRYQLGSKELQEQIDREVARAEKRHDEEIRHQQVKVDELTRQYSELEDEFRMALQIESSRFKELQEAFERLSEESSYQKQALGATTKKEEKSSSMVAELTALVKEQKGRITELARSKQEQIAEFKDRITTLEAHVDEAKKRMISMELLKQEKTRLSALATAQESIIEGLKAERKLWGEELAQQGSSLAQDRGRLEAKIEALAAETISLKRQLEREADAVKIKTKMIEDQTETIRKLKEGLLERDDSVRAARDEAVRAQREVEEQLTAEQSANADLQEKYDRARDRKEELKSEVSDLTQRLEKVTRDYSSLSAQWKDKSGLIGDLEQRVSHMKTTWDNKEKKLASDRDKAVDAARLAVEKLQAMDAAFRQQLEAKEFAHREALSRLEQDKEEELEAAHQRVLDVEEEMRILLRENESNKRALEDKFKGLSKQFDDLKGNLLS